MNRLLILLWVLALPVVAQSEFKEFSGAVGVINWSNGTVSAEGNGVGPEGGNPKTAGLLACRAAMADAQRNLLEASQGVRVTSETLVKDFVVASDEIRVTVEGLVKGATMLERKEDDGLCRVVLRMPLNGEMSKAVLQSAYNDGAPTVGAATPKISLLDWFIPTAHANESASGMDTWTSAYTSLSERLAAIEKRLEIIPDSTLIRQSDVQPTGLIIDARGSNFIPSLSPNIRQVKGGVVYPNKRARGSILDDGKMVALFARNVDFAMAHPKVGERPLLVKGLRTWGKTRTELVISKESAEKLTQMASNDFFINAGVIIVLD